MHFVPEVEVGTVARKGVKMTPIHIYTSTLIVLLQTPFKTFFKHLFPKVGVGCNGVKTRLNAYQVYINHVTAKAI